MSPQLKNCSQGVIYGSTLIPLSPCLGLVLFSSLINGSNGRMYLRCEWHQTVRVGQRDQQLLRRKEFKMMTAKQQDNEVEQRQV